MSLCLCGCGIATDRHWKPGHDKAATDAVLRLVTGYANITTVALNNRKLVDAALGR